MRSALQPFHSLSGPNAAIITRGRPTRTFRSLVAFLALVLLSLGVYLLHDAFAHPVAAQGGGLIVGAFTITLAVILLYFIFKPRRSLSDGGFVSYAGPVTPAIPLKKPSAAHWPIARKDLSFQRFYVDRARIRP